MALIEKRVEAGLPYGSLIDTIRRLLIVLDRNSNVVKILVFKNGTKTELNNFYKLLINLKNLNTDEWERICTRGRMHDYGIDKYIAKKITSRIVSVEIININESKISNLKKRITNEIYENNIAKKPFSRLDRSESIKLHPIRDLDYSRSDNLLFNRTIDLFKYAEYVLMNLGEIGKDRNDLGRIQLKEQFSAKMHPDEGLDEAFREAEIFLKNQGIANPLKVYENCTDLSGIFGEKIYGTRKRKEGDAYKNYEHFFIDFIDIIKNNRFCYSNILSLITEEDGKYTKTQVGWESITPHLSSKNEAVIISFTHTLRSVDLYDGLPYNIYFGMKISKDIIDNLIGRLELDGIEKNIQLGHIEFTIKHLHAYLDSVPLQIIINKGGCIND